MKIRIIAIISAIVLALGGGGTALGVYLYNASQPENVALAAIGGVLEEVGERKEIKPLVEAMSGGSLSFDIGRAYYNGTSILGMSGEGKIYFGKNALAVESLDLDIEGLPRFGGDAYIDNNIIYINEENVIGKPYAITVDTFYDEFCDSIFIHGSGSKYSIDDPTVSEALKSAYRRPKDDEIRRELLKVEEDHIKEIWRIFCDHAEFTSEVKDVKVGGGRDKYRVINIELDGDDLSEAIEEYIEYFKGDHRISDLINKHWGYFTLALYPYIEEDDDVRETYADLVDKFEEALRDVAKECDWRNSINIEIVTPRFSSTLLSLTATFDDESFTVDLGERGIAKTDSIAMGNPDNWLEIEIDDSEKKYELAVSLNKEEILCLTVDKAKEAFKLETDAAVLSGEFSSKKDSISVEIDNIKLLPLAEGGGETINIGCEMSFTLRRRDKMPKIPTEYATLSEITDKDVAKWIDEFGKELE